MKNSADVGFNKLSFSNVFWLRVECTFQNQNLCQCVYEPYDFGIIWKHIRLASMNPTPCWITLSTFSFRLFCQIMDKA